MQQKIIHDKEKLRFLITVEGHTGYVEYRITQAIMELRHTYVPEELQGRGIAAILVTAALEYAVENGLIIKPVCSYVKSFLQKNSSDFPDLKNFV